MSRKSKRRPPTSQTTTAVHQDAPPGPRLADNGLRAPLTSANAFAVGVLMLTSVITTWPTWRDGHFTYLDNPAHLAEIHSLAFDAHNGWSELAYCGYPLGSLHSPLWYGLLTAVARVGVPVEPLYAFLVWLGFVAPALALFFVARRHLPAVGAAILAYLLMMQRPVLVGLGSANAGMWTSYLGAAGVILLADRISRPCRTNRDLAALAALVALCALTHLYTLLPMLVLAAAHVLLWTVRPAHQPGQLGREAAAGLLGALVASMYWLQPMLVRSHAEIIPNDLPLSGLLARLLLPISLVEARHLPAPQVAWILDAAPMFLLVLFGVLGAIFVGRRRSSLPLYGLALFLGFAGVLVLVTFRDLPLLGNYSWRMLYYVRVGLALAAIPFMAMMLQRLRGVRWAAAVAPLVAVVSGLWFSQSLDHVVLRRHSFEVQEIRSVWEWLRQNHQPSWGRVYVQGTFGSRIPSLPLRNSHIMALTARQTGVEQLGAFYGGMPIRTTVWTTSEFGRVFGRVPSDEQGIHEVLQNAFFANATHLLISNPQVAQSLQESGLCEVIYSLGAYAVLAIRGAQSNWLYSGVAGVQVTKRTTGSLEIVVDEQYPGGEFLVKEAFHPFWQISGDPTASIDVEAASRLISVHTGPGPHTLVLRYAPPRWPWIASLLGFLGLVALTFWRRSGTPANS